MNEVNASAKEPLLGSAWWFRVHSDSVLRVLSKMHALFSHGTHLTLWIESGKLHLSAVDAKNFFQAQLPVEVDQGTYCDNSRTAVMLQLLHDLVRTGTGIWTFTRTAGQLILSFHKGRYELPTTVPEVIQEWFVDYEEVEWVLSATDLTQILKDAAIASGDQVQRGVYLHYDEENKCIAAAATDGLRISCARHPYTGPAAGAILSKELSNALGRWLDQGDIRVSLKSAKDPINFRWIQNNIEYWVRTSTMQYKFPNYKPVIPTSGQSIEVEGPALSAALARAALFAQDNTRRVLLEPQGETLVVQSSSIDIGCGKESIPARCSPGATRWCVDTKVLTDILGKEKVILQGEPNGAIRVYMRENWIYVFMPVIVQGT